MIIVSIFDIIINKLDYWYKLSLIILLKVDKYIKIYFYYTIFLLSLFINLRIKYSKLLMFYAEKVLK